MSTKSIVGIMLLALVAIWVFASPNEIASVFIVMAIASFAYATARRRHSTTKRSEK